MSNAPGLPSIDALVRRLAETPPVFLAEPKSAKHPEGVNTTALLHDVLSDFVPPDPNALDTIEQLLKATSAKQSRNFHRVLLVGAWLLADPTFRANYVTVSQAVHTLRSLVPLAELVSADLFVRDPDRREELVRTTLKGLGLPPLGETPAHAEDRLTSLSSVVRSETIKATRAAEEHARQVRKKMEEEAAKQAAARYSSE